MGRIVAAFGDVMRFMHSWSIPDRSCQTSIIAIVLASYQPSDCGSRDGHCDSVHSPIPVVDPLASKTYWTDWFVWFSCLNFSSIHHVVKTYRSLRKNLRHLVSLRFAISLASTRGRLEDTGVPGKLPDLLWSWDAAWFVALPRVIRKKVVNLYVRNSSSASQFPRCAVFCELEQETPFDLDPDHV